MKKSRKTGIRLSIEKLLIPALEAAGFQNVPEPPAQRLPQHNPWGSFRRRDERGVAVVEIQFDKNWLSQFRLNLSREGVETHYTLTRWGLPLRRWFGVRKKAHEGITEQEYDAAVMQAVRCLPQVERLFATGQRAWRMAEYPEPGWVFWAQAAFWLPLGLLAIGAPFYAFIRLVGWVTRLIRN